MLKRTEQAGRWSDEWFQRLPPQFKLAWLYALDHCDAKTGELKIDENLATFEIGIAIDWEAFVSLCFGRVEMDVFGVMWIKDPKYSGKALIVGDGKYPASFEAFWQAYPSVRKCKKGDAARAWAKAVKIASEQVLIEAAKEYAESPLGSGEYSAMPSTWLNSRMWEDDRAAWWRDQRKKSYAQQRDENTDLAGDRFVQKWSNAQLESLK